MAETRVLVFGPSFDAVRAKLEPLAGLFTPLVVEGDGTITLAGRPIDIDEARPNAAWASGELYESPAARGFLVAALKSPALRWVQSGAAGFDNPIFAQVVAKGAILTTSHGQSVGMAEYVLAGVLDHFQDGPQRRRNQADGLWRRLTFREIAGTTWLIVGFGAIGQDVARRARAFGAQVVGVRRDPSPHPLADAIIGPGEVSAQLPLADVVVLCLPAARATRHIADAGFFAAMKAGSVLINVGRGALVDEAALLAALDRGTPAHAVLDVFETEPLPADSRFWSHPRVALTSHASGNTAGQHARNQDLFVENLGRFVAGRPLIGEVNSREVLEAAEPRGC